MDSTFSMHPCCDFMRYEFFVGQPDNLSRLQFVALRLLLGHGEPLGRNCFHCLRAMPGKTLRADVFFSLESELWPFVGFWRVYAGVLQLGQHVYR